MLEYARNTDYMLLNEKNVLYSPNDALRWKAASCLTGKAYFVDMIIMVSIFSMTVLFDLIANDMFNDRVKDCIRTGIDEKDCAVGLQKFEFVCSIIVTICLSIFLIDQMAHIYAFGKLFIYRAWAIFDVALVVVYLVL